MQDCLFWENLKLQKRKRKEKEKKKNNPEMLITVSMLQKCLLLACWGMGLLGFSLYIFMRV